MKCAVITAVLASTLVATPARASADTEFASKLAFAVVIKTLCSGYELAEGSGANHPKVVRAVREAIKEQFGASYRAGDLIPEISKVTKVAAELTIMKVAQDKDGTCKDLGAELVRAGLLERK
ncbi:hypothetical protein [Bradyrhizobium sp. 2S1]|uniref:hypothetical protein n=1 Tax=Bradyrhizobium sp. 2S1 TaxID=1404429 RepID=UPI00140C93D6|nr:hypothetical protein [Bradyrhizobium sp. 2S1]MCK7667964.1 hypothetical protein [Bradyrhizobium sp. 2S1]